MSILQPLNVSINKPFKDNIQCFCSEWMKLGNDQTTPDGKLGSLPYMWMDNPSMGAHQQRNCFKSFKKTGISNPIDGTEYGILWNADNEQHDVLSEPYVSEDSDDGDENDDNVQ